MNSPIRFSDPTGHMVANDDDGGDYDPNYCETHPTECARSGGGGDGEGGGNPDEELKKLEDELATCSTNPVAEGCRPDASPQYSNQPVYSVREYKLVITWSEIDWLHLAANFAALVGDGLSLVALLSGPGAVPVLGLATAINMFSIAVDAHDAITKGDISGGAKDIAAYVLEKKFPKLIPIYGALAHAQGAAEALASGISIVPVQRPLDSAQPWCGPEF